MKILHTEEIASAVRDLCIRAATELPKDVLQALESALKREESDAGRDVLKQLIENARLACEDSLPICQDTGLAILFVRLGHDVRIEGGGLEDALAEGVRRGYADGYLRKSVVHHPFERKNTGDNTPPIIHIEIVPGDKLHITLLAKGGGCENMSALRMLKPADGIEGARRFVVEAVKNAGANACPPVVVGVGIGGSMEKAALMAKHSLVRPIGSTNPDPALAEFETDLLNDINALGTGPAGFGGRVTALAVFVEAFPCHIASLPVAVNLECHAHRHAVAEL